MQVLFFAPFFRVSRNRGWSAAKGGNGSRARVIRRREGTNILKEVPLFMRVKVTLACTECKQRNYDTMKNKKNDPDRLEMNKYCRFCRKHTPHRETK